MYLTSRQLNSYRTATQNGIPVYVFRLASLAGTLQRELNAIPEERRYQRMCVLYSLPLIPPTDAWPRQCRPLGVYVSLHLPAMLRTSPFPSGPIIT